MQSVTVDPLVEFFDAIKSPLTKDRYEKRFDLFLKGISMEGSTLQERAKNFADKARDTQWVTVTINNYMRYQKQRAEKGEISESTVPNYYKPVKLFLEMNDITLNWKKISKRIPQGRSYALDRTPTPEEIKTLIAYPDRRIKAVVLTMLSSGFRLGAWDYLKWGHIEPIEKDGPLLAAKVKVYAGEAEEYFTFITPEAYSALKEWMDFREQHGEKITKNSPLMRDLWDATSKAKRGLASAPQPLKSTGIKRLLERALWAQGLWQPLEEGKKRHEFSEAHSLRKLFKSICERRMKSLHVELLMGHSLGLGNNYYRPSEQEILDEYLKAVPELTILETISLDIENVKTDLTKKIEELEGKLHERDTFIKEQAEAMIKMDNSFKAKLKEHSDLMQQVLNKLEKEEESSANQSDV
ncbi:MAG: hypothetical protein M1503_03515 [Thaumarchaeota archaeon]|nr:hypothetical protein [Nitrososphaerota archaeon]MCL5317321.1 hypothetical protein [Nitrososphaerota archaeon]